MIFLYLATPCLGCLRNYVKYKKINFLLFIRTPLTYLLIKLIFQRSTIWNILIFERWFFLIYKTILSIWNNDYINKREKYIIKYGLNYGIKYKSNI